jgi:hypothetical protein
MKTTPTPGSAVDLPARALHEVADACGTRIECQEGCVWITLDHDSRDIVLEQGESFTATEHARALVYAFEPARLLLQPSLLAERALVQQQFGQRSRTTAQVAV